MAVALKKKEMDALKKVLIEEKGKILSHLESLSVSAGQELEVGSGDSVDIASLEISQASLQKIGKREQYLSKKIDLALAKIEEGTYGLCEECEEPIGYARLMARPVAQLCIDCKTIQESTERKFSSREKEAQDDELFEEDTEEGA